jgi:uncharacterized protein YndB with AHSA1/START domain
MTTGAGLELRITKALPVPRDEAYAALIDPGRMGDWWGPNGFTIPEIDFKPRVGAGYRIAMQPPDGELFHLSGEFHEVDPPARLAYTFRWDPPAEDDQETLATISLAERGEETELILTQGEFATEERLGVHRDGWTEGLGRLAQMLHQDATGRTST